ncbi:MAG: hypothetical protein HGB12_18125, partial [Bacteroidetes bacterium]|nr:hypothetical protein [Bacteroidota bacterium]
NRGSLGLYWSSTQNTSDFGLDLRFDSSSSCITNIHDKAYGFSIRCIKD